MNIGNPYSVSMFVNVVFYMISGKILHLSLISYSDSGNFAILFFFYWIHGFIDVRSFSVFACTLSYIFIVLHSLPFFLILSLIGFTVHRMVLKIISRYDSLDNFSLPSHLVFGFALLGYHLCSFYLSSKRPKHSLVQCLSARYPLTGKMDIESQS